MMQAVSLTAGVLFVMMFVYATRLIRVTDKLQNGDRGGDRRGGAFLRRFAWCFSLFGFGIPMVFAATPLGIGFSLFVVGLAAFNLLLDFDFIEKSAQHEAPKYMEWYGAFGLMVTLIWLYLEILRLLIEAGRSAVNVGWRPSVSRSMAGVRRPLTRPLRCLDSGL